MIWERHFSHVNSSRYYIQTTDFVTGVPFPSQVGAGGSKATNYLQYTYLMLYLERKNARHEEMTPLETQVCIAPLPPRTIHRGRHRPM